MKNILVKTILLFGLSLASTLVLAQNPIANSTDPKESDPLRVDAQMRPYEWSPGQSGKLTMQLTLPPGYHAYVDQFDFTILEPDGFKKSSLQITPIKKWFDKFSKKNREGIEGSATIIVQLEAPSKFLQDADLLKYELKYQACSDTFCLFPVTKELNVPIKLLNATPTFLSADSSDSMFSQARLSQLLGQSIGLALLIAFLAGILTSFTPCIFPMIPITLAILGRDVEKKSRLQNFLTSLFYVLGIAFTYSSLGVLAASSGKLFGASLGNPWVLGVLCVLLFLMALSLFGLYELQMPAFIRNRLGVQKQSGSANYFTAFVSGLLAGVVASPCVGPVLVAILSYVASQKDLFLGFWLLFAYALGLGMIFLLLGVFTNLLNYLPRSGKWMIRFKQVLGFMIILVMGYYLSLLLPRIGNASNNNEHAYVEPLKNEEWKVYSEEIYKQALKDGKPIIIDFFAEWCAACHELEQKTFSHPDVKALAKDFVLLRFDATTDSPQMEDFKKKYMIVGLPTVIFYSPKGKWQKNLTLTEFEDTPKFLARMKSALEAK